MRLLAGFVFAVALCAQSSGRAIASGQTVDGGTLPIITLVQHPYTLCPGIAGGSPCSLTLSKPTTAGNLLILAAGAESTYAGAAPVLSGASGDGTWVHPSGCLSSLAYLALLWRGTTDCVYILSATGGASTVAWTWAANVAGTYVELLEISKSAGAWAFDAAGITSAICTTCVAPALTLTGPIDYIAQWVVPFISVSKIAGGAGYSMPADFNTSGNFGVAGAASNNGTAPTWTQPGVAHPAAMTGVAFK